jgi:hypothetical protein
MQGAQRGVTHEDDAQFEIADFRDTLKKCIEDEETVYGYKNKPRNQEPSMFQLLSWQDKEDALWDYTKKDKHLIEASVANQLKYKINKASTHWVTENMDQFRKFTYSPSKKAVFFDLEDPNKGRPSASKGTISKELAEHLNRTPKSQDVYVKELPTKTSETLDKYTIQDLKNLKDVLKVIENRAISKGGEVIKNPIAHQLTDHYNYQDEFDREERERNGDYEEEQQEEESSEEDIKVDKADYSNVQSRLLTKSIKKAKELDPVYEKERLQRRKDRIQRLNETTRWLPNSSFKTYFGKPPFENYGRGNVNPTVGGSVYGDYMKTHNINPHAGDNKPEFKQIYDRADLVATRYPDAQPEPPRKCKDDFRLSQKQVDDLKRRNPLVPGKFEIQAKTIVKPDLINSLRFASEENTPENSVDEKNKSAKPARKNLGESLKQLNKKTKAIRKEIAKNSPTEVAKQRNKSEPKVKKQEKLYRATQELLRQENQKAATAHKEEQETRKTQPQSEGKQLKAQPRVSDANSPNKERASSRKTKKTNEDHDIAEEFDYSKQTPSKQPAQQKGRNNESQGVRELMNDPASAFVERPKSRGGKVEAERSPKKEVSFKPTSDNKSANKFKEAPVVAQQVQKEHHDFGRVEELQTLLRESQKNDKLWDKANADMNGTLNVNPMAPPKNYLFSLAQKETDPRYYKNVPAVWLNRIPYAGKKTALREDIKGVFGHAE